MTPCPLHLEFSVNTLTVVIPALNERENLEPLMKNIPVGELYGRGWDTEVLLVDNGSTDGTGAAARRLGARVIVQPARGYGNAYRLGFANSLSDVVVTGDADLTYPFDALPELLKHFKENKLDFMTTNRLLPRNAGAMKPSHTVGNRALTAASRTLFRAPFKDSQSGMWLFHRYVWDQLDVRSPGMAFSQEIKNEAFLKGFRCDEVDIDYRARGGEVKLNAAKDGLRNLGQLAVHRARGRRSSLAPVISVTELTFEHDAESVSDAINT
jgi:glycosyltransferase involved in cell wall biosynthesis